MESGFAGVRAEQLGCDDNQNDKRRTLLTVPHTAGIVLGHIDTNCVVGTVAGPISGDYGAFVQYNIGTMGSGSKKVVKVSYRVQ